MGIVDNSSLHRCGVRMNGVLIEWNPWLGYFIFFTFYTYVHVTQYKKPYLQKSCIPFYNSAVGIQ